MSKFIEGINEMPRGGIQNILLDVAKNTREGYGGPTAEAVKLMSDHAAGVTFALNSTRFIGPVENAMPSFNFRTTKHVREGKVFGVDLETLQPYSVPKHLDPRKAPELELKHLKN